MLRKSNDSKGFHYYGHSQVLQFRIIKFSEIFLTFSKKHETYKNISHFTMVFEILCFGILPDNRHTNIHKTTRLKIIKIIFYQPPKLPSLITKKNNESFSVATNLSAFSSRAALTVCHRGQDLGRDSELPCVRPSEDQKPRKTNGQKALFP